MDVETSKSKNALYKFFYNNKAFVKDLPIGKHLDEHNPIEFPPAIVGDNFCCLYFSAPIMQDLNSLQSTYDIDFIDNGCHITVYANNDYCAPITETVTHCHFTFKYTLKHEHQELRIYFANDGKIIKTANNKDKIFKAIINLNSIKNLFDEFSKLLGTIEG